MVTECRGHRRHNLKGKASPPQKRIPFSSGKTQGDLSEIKLQSPGSGTLRQSLCKRDTCSRPSFAFPSSVLVSQTGGHLTGQTHSSLPVRKSRLFPKPRTFRAGSHRGLPDLLSSNSWLARKDASPGFPRRFRDPGSTFLQTSGKPERHPLPACRP